MAFGGNSSFGTSGGGAASVSSLTGLGTGVATALAVNVGSAGAPVVFNGALGTPSSGNLSNCTGIPAASQSLSTQVEFWDDFIGYSPSTTVPTGMLGFTALTSGTAAAVTSLAIPDNTGIGVYTAITGTTTTGRAALLSYPSLCFGSGALIWEARIQIPTLSDGTETFTVRAGLLDSPTTQTNAAYFSYTHGTNSGKFQCITSDNGTPTTADSGITVVAGTWYRLRIEVNAAGTSAAFFINSASAAATNSANIPTGAAKPFAGGFGIVKSAGTTSRSLYADYEYLKWTPTAAR